MSTSEIIARFVAMIAMVVVGGYAFFSGIFLCRFYFAFGSGKEGFILSPFKMAMGVK